MNKKVPENIPKLPGIYVFKNIHESIIYIGKAKNLYKRVASYFQKQTEDWKVLDLIKEHTNIEYIITKSETEALLLEAQLIKKFKPKYNVLLKNSNPFVYIEITDADLPKINLVNRKKKSGTYKYGTYKSGTYFGPFLYRKKARSVYEYLIRTFNLKICSTKIGSKIKPKTEQACLDYHLGNCSGSCLNNFDFEAYKYRINLAKELLNGNLKTCEESLKSEIKKHNENFEFEKSRNLTEYLHNLESIFEMLSTKFSETKYRTDINFIVTPNKYKVQYPLQALEDLQTLLNLEKKPKSIDCFDISHFQSSYLVGSCVRFTYGIPDKNNFRRFKIKTLIEQNDYAALQEIVLRRYKDPKNLPDIILIDGGKGQLSAITALNLPITVISIAKEEETLFAPNLPDGIKLDIKTDLGQLIIALRDYTHHFAISYHKLLRDKAFTKF